MNSRDAHKLVMSKLFFFILGLLITVGVFSGNPIEAQIRSSSNYQIQSDSINVGGGFSSSTSYLQESSVGEIATGRSSSTNFIVGAGYQQMQLVSLSLTAAADVSMSPALGGLTGGESNGSTTVIATTDAPSGYQLSIEAENNPAMQSGANTIADYSPSGVDPDRVFQTDSNEAHLAFSPYGDDIPDRFKDDDTDCNAGTNNTAGECWDGLSTVSQVIAQSSNANQPDGATTTIYFRVGVGGEAAQAPGLYTATTTLTLISL